MGELNLYTLIERGFFYVCTQTGDNNLWTQFDNLKVVYVNDINLL